MALQGTFETDLISVTFTMKPDPEMLIYKALRHIYDHYVSCPVGERLIAELVLIDGKACSQETMFPCGSHRLLSMIIHLNDGHGWTREAIADWVESLDIDLTFPVME